MKTLIIAEAGVNHNGSIALAKQLIDAAAIAGADFVKFQTFKAEKLVSKEAKRADYQKANLRDSDDSQLEMLKKLELKEEDHFVLQSHAKEKGIKFFSTAFDEESIDFIAKLDPHLYKVPSGEITNLPYLRKVAQKKKPTILSTGMATLGEIEQALSVLLLYGLNLGQITVLHCTTEYPAPFSEINLKAMDAIRCAFGVNVGYSDHTIGIEVPIAAVALGATCIEKHFTIDRKLEGPDHIASLEPLELKSMVSAIRNIEAAIGGNGIKTPTVSELKNRDIARKSIHLNADLPIGHTLQERDLIMKRPGNGISPMNLDIVIGRKLNQALIADTMLQYTHIS